MSDPEPGLDLGGLLGGLGGGDGGGLGDLFAQAQAAMQASQDAASTEVEGSSGGGVVRIRATGGGEVRAVAISPEVVDPDDVDTLEALVLAAFRDVNAQIARLHEQAMGGLGGLGDLGSLFGTEVIDADGEE